MGRAAGRQGRAAGRQGWAAGRQGSDTPTVGKTKKPAVSGRVWHDSYDQDGYLIFIAFPAVWSGRANGRSRGDTNQ